ncbi:M23 family metallopeptidase, partial [Jatrophihabitans sp. YIM 134969]
VAPAGLAPSLRPVRVPTGLRGAALKVPVLAGGWRLPTRTPLVLAGAVAVTVVVTDQAGLLSSTEAGAAATAAQQRVLTANAAAETQQQAVRADQAAADAAASEGARQARARVSRLERSPLTAASSTTTPATPGAAPTPAGTAVAAAPPPDSVMKPGQTVPGDWVRPTAKGIYNSCFCARWGTMHEGIDFAAPLGSPILAVGDGVVVQAGPASGFGNWVIIQHENGDMTIYGHMKYYFVKVGQKVKAGQEIALVGQEGQSTGPHLHLGVKIGSTTGHDGTYVDPVPWLVARGISVGTYNQNG